MKQKRADSNAVLLFDGVFLFRPELLDRWDYKIFLDIDFTVSVERGIGRDAMAPADPNAVRALYEHRYVPGQRIYLKECNPKGLADVVIDNNDIRNPTLF